MKGNKVNRAGGLFSTQINTGLEICPSSSGSVYIQVIAVTLFLKISSYFLLLMQVKIVCFCRACFLFIYDSISRCTIQVPTVCDRVRLICVSGRPGHKGSQRRQRRARSDGVFIYSHISWVKNGVFCSPSLMFWTTCLQLMAKIIRSMF